MNKLKTTFWSLENYSETWRDSGDLLELELPISSKVDFLVLKISQLNCHEEAVLALGPFDLREKTKK